MPRNFLPRLGRWTLPQSAWLSVGLCALGLGGVGVVRLPSQLLAQAQAPAIDDQALPQIPNQILDGAAAAAIATGRHGIVVTTQREATRVGLAILEQGGNAVDAAIAIGYALAVTDPCCGNLGGGGFMLIRPVKGKATFVDFRETAPAAASPEKFLDQQQVVSARLRTGYLAVGVPGTVKGLEYARQHYGSLPRQALISPAIALASQGYTLQAGDVEIFQAGLRLLTLDPQVAQVFLQPNRQPFPVGYQLRQPDLAETLKRIRAEGEAVFYKGAIAKAVVAASQAAGGALSLQDFQDYQVRESPPLVCTYRGYTVLTAPLPGGGTTLCQLLQILEGYPFQASDWRTPATLHRFLSAMLFAYADRNRYLGDPAFVQPPLKRLLSKTYAQKLRQMIPLDRALPPEPLYQNWSQSEGENTTHYSVIDRQGNAVSVTYTINGYFGAGVMAKGTGFLLNNEMDDFTVKPGVANSFGVVQGNVNRIQPGKRPLSSMSPTMLLKKQKIELITGSPGGSTIPTTVLNLITDRVDFQRSLPDSIQSPRIHYQGLPKEVLVEPEALPASTQQRLEEMGYTFRQRLTWGAAESIAIDPKTGVRMGVNDPRKPAGAALAEN